MKKRILRFYGVLLIIVGILIIIQITSFGGFGGYVINNNQFSYTKVNDSSFQASIVNYGKDGNYLNVNYALQELSGKNQDIKVTYSVLDSRGKMVKQGSQEVILESGSSKNYILRFDMPLYGNFKLNLDINGNTGALDLEKEISLSNRSPTGLVISDDGKRILSLFGLILSCVIIVFALFRLINIDIKSKKEVLHRDRREIVKLDLK